MPSPQQNKVPGKPLASGHIGSCSETGDWTARDWDGSDGAPSRAGGTGEPGPDSSSSELLGDSLGSLFLFAVPHFESFVHEGIVTLLINGFSV
jgi:hypothetical protein